MKVELPHCLAAELVGSLIMGHRNRLTRHQERSEPFRLFRLDVPATRNGFKDIAVVRCGELDGFVEGLLGAEDRFELPETANKSLDALAQARARCAALRYCAILAPNLVWRLVVCAVLPVSVLGRTCRVAKTVVVESPM
jgi:hypothetical protein